MRNRIVFLDYLRGIACLVVVWAHIYVVGINDPNTVRIWVPPLADYMFGEGTPSANVHGQINTWLVLTLGMSSGGWGVAIFFVISGFVILMSIDRLSAATFIKRRFMRIVPLNAIVVLLTAAAMKLLANLYGTDIGINASSIVSSSFAFNYWTSDFTILPILWTLEAEMFFYVFMAVAAASVGRLSFLHLLILCLICFFATYTLADVASPNGNHFAVLFTHVSFMLIGSIIFRAVETQRVMAGLVAAALALLICYACFWSLSAEAGVENIGYSFPYVLAALAVFMPALITGMRSRIFAPLGFFGRISYPMYLVHVPIGWWAMWMMGKAGLGMYTATTAAFAAVVFISWVLHETVEKPIQEMAKGRGRLPPAAPVTAPG